MRTTGGYIGLGLISDNGKHVSASAPVVKSSKTFVLLQENDQLSESAVLPLLCSADVQRVF